MAKHPAVYSPEILATFEPYLYGKVLDPFAGTGLIHTLPFDTVGVELEPEWAEMTKGTIVGNALSLPFPDDTFDCVATSPTYANRFADHHNAQDGSVRRSYTHDIGRPLHIDNSGQLQWGSEYCFFHDDAWCEALRVLRSPGRFVLNCKDHIRKGMVQPVTGWHITTLCNLGLRLQLVIPVFTNGMGFGENADQRTGYEYVCVFDAD